MAFLIIILICYLVVAFIRKTPLKNEYLPLISGTLGLVLGIVAFYVFPSIVPGETIVTTMIYGLSCGLAATGSNQVFKQAVKFIKAKYNININLPTVTSKDEYKEENYE